MACERFLYFPSRHYTKMGTVLRPSSRPSSSSSSFSHTLSVYMTSTVLFLSLFLCHVLVDVDGSAYMSYLSFKPPFESFAPDGKRTISSSWTYGGDTAVQKYFVRLTPDRQSKNGYVFSQAPLGVNDFSTTFRFRLSGQAKSLFGDGIQFWVTDKQVRKPCCGSLES